MKKSLFKCGNCNHTFSQEKVRIDHAGEETYYMCPNCGSEDYAAIKTKTKFSLGEPVYIPIDVNGTKSYLCYAVKEIIFNPEPHYKVDDLLQSVYSENKLMTMNECLNYMKI